jgi:hypothetical protein
MVGGVQSKAVIYMTKFNASDTNWRKPKLAATCLEGLQM